MTQNKHNGWCDRILKVNLTEGRVEILPLELDMAKKYLGGRGMNSWTLYHLAKTDVFPIVTTGKPRMSTAFISNPPA